MLLDNKWINNEIKEKSKKYLKTNENEKQWPKIYGTSQRSSTKFRAIAAIVKQEKSQINNVTLQLKKLEKEQNK